VPCNSRAVFTAALQVKLSDVLGSPSSIEAIRITIRQHLKLPADAQVNFVERAYASYFNVNGYIITLTEGGIQVTGPYGWDGNALKNALAEQVKTLGRMGAQRTLVTALRKLGRIESDRVSAASGARVVQATLSL
jgi:hypothetical protein